MNPRLRTGPGGGRMVEGLNRLPLSAAPSSDVTARGTLIRGDGTSYEIAETNLAGDTVRRLSRPGPLPTIPEEERRDSAATLRARIAALPVPLDRVQGVPESVKSGIIPQTYPAYLRLYGAADGRTWVERPPPAGKPDTTFWDVWDAGGRFLGVVSAPVKLLAEPRPVFTPTAIYGVARDPETDEQLLVRLTFSPPGRRASR
ncbi:MAG: hypothetical protein KY464_11570 [Gemmatimonadetes bacterium]|nr:hypothetical protein [Gemmatimonadota bacterium]